MALYFVLFAISLFNIMALPSRTLAEMAPILFTSLVLSLTGVLIALWVYQDGEEIKKLKETIQQQRKQGEKDE